jgi:nitroimidazol reductase NimA-like FMN-containing flavoprotein (pyridoxamine 5'-phosphate oxidase superfamily)
MSWKTLEDQNPELAAFGLARLNGQVAYLATTRKDGSPRVHPMTPAIGEGHLYIFMEPTSPKGHDLRRDPRYAIHCAVTDNSGESGEFYISGRASFVEDSEKRAQAVRVCSYKPADRYILFEFEVEAAASTVYPEGKAAYTRWKAAP